jgi:hypothetical protein
LKKEVILGLIKLHLGFTSRVYEKPCIEQHFSALDLSL